MKMGRCNGGCKILRASLTGEDGAAYNGERRALCMKKLLICLKKLQNFIIVQKFHQEFLKMSLLKII